MTVLDKDLTTISKKIQTNEVTSQELVTNSIDRAKKYQTDYNSFVTILDNAKSNIEADSILNGIPYALKDNISTKGILTTASSNILSDYVPVFSATVYERLEKSGAVLIGKTVLDELAMGGKGVTAHTGVVKNPWNSERIIGGSSAGSAAAVSLGIVPFAIGTDTGNSVRRPAGYGGIVGFKPTYGLISRFGVIPFSSSLDHVGIMTRSVMDVAYVLDAVKGIDEKDMTSYNETTEFANNISNDVTGKKLFYIKEIVEALKPKTELYDNFIKTIDYAKSLGIEVLEESIDKKLLEAIFPAYMTISSAEATSNSSNLTGVVFGSRVNGVDVDEIMFNTRTKGFSAPIKRRFIIGGYVLQTDNKERFLDNAGRIRRLLVEKMNKFFSSYDGMILPNGGSIAPKFNDSSEKNNDDLLLNSHLMLGNFGGFPSITIPSGIVSDMPVAINITGRVKDDLTVLKIAKALEEKIEFKYLNERGGNDV